MAIIVTGGAGFIGSNFILQWLATHDESVINLDVLTYAGNLENLASVASDPRYCFVHGDIGDAACTTSILKQQQPRAIINFAAESHVDRSITGPKNFIQTNINGTFHLLEVAKDYWNELSVEDKDAFRFLHVSTDEVYGTLTPEEPAFTEKTRYAPNSPYSASKAASDHLVRAYHHTYGLPVLTTNCSNNYGPYQFPEKLIPLCIHRALNGEPLPIYGDGQQIRDWLYVEDHCDAITCVLASGCPGEVYNIGGCNEQTNISVVQKICGVLDRICPRNDGHAYAEQMVFVRDRPGHDRRYAINPEKIEQELDWRPSETFDSGLAKTVRWYLDHKQWMQNVTSGAYHTWLKRQYGG